MTWMAKWVGGHPVYAASARGARIEDVDGHTYVDFALGDTGAMAGHSPEPTVAAVQRRIGESGRRPTLPFNGYGDEVASLYAGLDLRQNY